MLPKKGEERWTSPSHRMGPPAPLILDKNSHYFTLWFFLIFSIDVPLISWQANLIIKLIFVKTCFAFVSPPKFTVSICWKNPAECRIIFWKFDFNTCLSIRKVRSVFVTLLVKILLEILSTKTFLKDLMSIIVLSQTFGCRVKKYRQILNLQFVQFTEYGGIIRICAS